MNTVLSQEIVRCFFSSNSSKYNNFYTDPQKKEKQIRRDEIQETEKICGIQKIPFFPNTTSIGAEVIFVGVGVKLEEVPQLDPHGGVNRSPVGSFMVSGLPFTYAYGLNP